MKPSIEDFKKWESQLRPVWWVLSGLSFALALWLSLSIAEDMAALLSPGEEGWWQAGAVLFSVIFVAVTVFPTMFGGSEIDRLIAEVKAAAKEEENDLEH
ncbi:hypothetical protein I5K48_26825 [Pseudomonas aeruginosa]|nr:hypothetical protein [Pseudomonas aeruginosa]MBH9226003.1 hypothetical protein [Pseudomonas aeruginosa]HDU8926329.1 hypothetical protein [Pseudomonas aeruginosa]HDU9094836.1 hypothetical protein [Pseudomonas aeruginosa]